MQDLAAWLNSNRDYKTGVQIYLKYGDNQQFVQLLLDGETQYTRANLFENLKTIYYQIKNGTSQTNTVVKKQHTEVTVPVVPHPDQKPVVVKTQTPKLQKGTLYDACKLQADKLYKELMNLRAELFQLCPIVETKMENDEFTFVNDRRNIVLRMMDLQYETDQAYDKLRYVEEHGVLPTVKEAKEEEIPSNPIQLMNFKKNLVSGINKLKKKEQTPERIALLTHKLNQLTTVNEQISKLVDA